MSLDDEELKSTRILNGAEKVECHCETDLNKVSEIMKEREEKAFKYDCLMKKIKEKLQKLQEEYLKKEKQLHIYCGNMEFPPDIAKQQMIKIEQKMFILQELLEEEV